jgi:hypothetical protein
MAYEESERPASVLAAFPPVGVAARSWATAHSWEQLLEMSTYETVTMQTNQGELFREGEK